MLNKNECEVQKIKVSLGV